MQQIADIRTDYKLRTLDEADLHADAIEQFKIWFEEARHSEIEEVNAMTIATVNDEGAPSARIVLLKAVEANGFTFFTNYDSDKAYQMMQHHRVALLFFWKELQRQVRIEGSVEKILAEQSDAYFAIRPRGSQVGAWASPQSKVITSREILETNTKETEEKFAGIDVQRPPNWGGYIVHPASIEFWQGRSNRLHDRLKYIKENLGWRVERLAP